MTTARDRYCNIIGDWGQLVGIKPNDSDNTNRSLALNKENFCNSPMPMCSHYGLIYVGSYHTIGSVECCWNVYAHK